MGQSSSTSASSSALTNLISSRSTSPSPSSTTTSPTNTNDVIIISSLLDYTSYIPDECLASIFQSLISGDRKRCSLVCRRWLTVEGQSRHRLSLNAQAELSLAIPSLFKRFDSVTKLALKCDRRSVSINDEGLILISMRCRNLTRLKLRACRELTDFGMAEFARNCRSLKKLSCGSCTFGSKGMNALLINCVSLEELSVKRLRSVADGAAAAEPIGVGLRDSALKVICLKELYNGQCFGPLIIGAKYLRTLKLFRCSGDWDKILSVVADRVSGLVEVHLERLQVSDAGLLALSNCLSIEILHLVKTPECTNVGLSGVAERCKLLRKLHIDGWKTNRIGDEGLVAVAMNCGNLQELVLIGVNPTKVSLEKLASNCKKLERLALCGSESVGDPELSCIAEKCVALRKLCIKSCPVTDLGMEALAGGCPNLVKVKVKKCRLVTPEVADWLRSTRGSLAVNLDATEPENIDASVSESGLQEGGLENQHAGGSNAGVNIASGSTRRSSSFKSRLGLFSGKNWVACTLRMFSSSGGSSSSN